MPALVVGDGLGDVDLGRELEQGDQSPAERGQGRDPERPGRTAPRAPACRSGPNASRARRRHRAGVQALGRRRQDRHGRGGQLGVQSPWRVPQAEEGTARQAESDSPAMQTGTKSSSSSDAVFSSLVSRMASIR